MLEQCRSWQPLFVLTQNIILRKRGDFNLTLSSPRKSLMFGSERWALALLLVAKELSSYMTSYSLDDERIIRKEPG